MRTFLVYLILIVLTTGLYGNKSQEPNSNSPAFLDSLNREAFGLRTTDIDSATTLVERVIVLSRKSSYEKGLGTGLLIRGIIYKNNGEFTDAHRVFDEALLIRQKLKDSVGVAVIFHNLSSLEFMQGRYGSAIENSNKAIHILERTDQEFRLGNAYINLANVYKETGDGDKAIVWYNKARKILYDDQYSIAIIEENIASIFTENGEYDKALRYYFSALETYKDFEDLAAQAQVNNSIGHTYFKKGNSTIARSFFEKSAEQSEELGNDLLLGDAYANLGILYMRNDEAKGDNDSARYYVDQLEKILAENIGSKEERRKAALLFSEIYQKNGDFNNALKFMRKAYNVNEAIKEAEQVQKLAQERAKRDYVEQQIVIQRQFYINIILGLTILSCLGGLYFLFRMGRSKAKELKYLIETKDLEFATAKLKGEQTGRDRVARELHDDVSPTTVAIKRELEMAKKNTHDLEAMLKSLNIAMGITDKVYEKTRQLAYELQTKPLDWLDDIKFDINQLQREDIESKIIVHEIDETINARVGTEVSKILNVLLHNVRKHAKASKVSVDLTRISDELVIIIEDDGIGFNANNKQGLGLRSVKARVKDLKGEINIDSKIGQGTTIVVNIPLSGAAILQSN